MSEKQERFVLDAFALISHFEGGVGSDTVLDLLQRAAGGEVKLHLSTINLGEMVYIFERRRGADTVETMLSDVDQLPIEKEPVDWPRIKAAASLKGRHSVSYADAFAAALALELGCPVVTGDPEFASLESLIPIVWLRVS